MHYKSAELTLGNRVIHCVQTDSKYVSIWNLQEFECLSTIRLDWMSPRMMPYHGSDNPTDRLPFTNVSSSITELDIRGLPWPSPLVFHNIGELLPELKILRMQQHKIWCGLCHTCSVVRFRSPGPKSVVYEGGLGLPVRTQIRHTVMALKSKTLYRCTTRAFFSPCNISTPFS